MQELGQQVQAVLDDQVRPALQTHGGNLELVSVRPNEITLRFVGACQGCPFRAMTFAACIAPALAQLGIVSQIEIEGMVLPELALQRLWRATARRQKE
jgi:Fe-S cluster biogenesis protein NfuA